MEQPIGGKSGIHLREQKKERHDFFFLKKSQGAFNLNAQCLVIVNNLNIV